MKYQFCIRFENTTTNTAATKAVLDCNEIFRQQGYHDYTLTVWDNAQKLSYYIRLVKELVNFYSSIKKGSIVGIQYPLLSINNVFHVFMKLARFKGVKFFCVIHDLESLRTGGKDSKAIAREIKNLNFFDRVIVHNRFMLNWLHRHGMASKAISLDLFDYLSKSKGIEQNNGFKKTIAFAGNLSKSTFIYSLNKIPGWQFNVYGPNFNNTQATGKNLKWCGEYSAEQIAQELNGSFGLIWDGDDINKCDDILGNYLKYNNPHKFSLYIAAGLPVIAPASAAIGSFIRQNNIGLLINSLHDLQHLEVNSDEYVVMKNNVMKFRKRVINGEYFKAAIHKAELELKQL
jgi:hypothetical protein